MISETDSPAASPEQQASRSSHAFKLLACAILLFILTAAAFVPAVKNEFLQWDDMSLMTQNPYLNPPTLKGLQYLWANGYQRLYVPLFYTSFYIDLKLGGKPSPNLALLSHGENIVLHGLTAVAVFLLLSALVQARSGEKRAFAPLLGALVFALHPMQAEPVAWVTGRKELLSGLFIMLSLWQYARWRVHANGVRYTLSLLFFVLALLSKPAITSAPLAFLAIDFFLLRRRLGSSLLALLPFFICSAGWAIVTFLVQDPRALPISHNLPWKARPFIAGDAIAFYAQKVFWPAHLAPVYGRVPDYVMQQPYVHYELWIVLAVAAALLVRRTPAAAALAVAVAFLVPVLGFVPFDYQIRNSTVADRYMYYSLLGVAIAVTFTGLWLYQKNRVVSLICAVLMCCVALTCGAFSFAQSMLWRNSETLWRAAVQRVPESAVAHSNLGMVFGGQGKAQQAREQFEKAVQLRPDFAIAHNNLADLYGQEGKTDLAIEECKKAIEADPAFVYPQVGLALNYLRSNRLDEALTQARSALKLAPGMPQAMMCVATVLARQGKTADAEKELQSAIKINPDSPDLKMTLALVYVDMKRLDDALAQSRNALKLSPGLPDAVKCAATVLSQQGKFEEAEQVVKDAITASPDNPEFKGILEDLGNMRKAAGK